MAISGAMPDPPATRRSGPPSLVSQVNQPPIGPRSSSPSPARSTSVRYGETDVDVLTGFVTFPAGHLQDKSPGAGCLGLGLNYLADAPEQPATDPNLGHLSPPSSAARARGRRSCGSPRTPRSQVRLR